MSESPVLRPRADDHLSAALALENDELVSLIAPFDLETPTRTAVSEREARLQARLAATDNATPATAILRRHVQHKSSLEEAMLELYFGNLSMAGAEETARLLWGDHVDIAVVAGYCRTILARIDQWRQRRIVPPQVYVYFQTIEVKQKRQGERTVETLVATIGVSAKGTRDVLAVSHFTGEAADDWTELLKDLKRRGLRGTQLFIGGNERESRAAVARHFPGVAYQGCVSELEQLVLARVSVVQAHLVMTAFELVRATTTADAARRELRTLGRKLREQGAGEAARLVEAGAPEVFSYFQFPQEHWTRIHEIEPLGRPLREFRECVRSIGPLDDSRALLMLLSARLRHASRVGWARRRFINFQEGRAPRTPRLARRVVGS